MAELDLSDELARELYALIVGVSFDGAERFEGAQEAWKAVAKRFGIVSIERNGHGRVMREATPSKP